MSADTVPPPAPDGSPSADVGGQDRRREPSWRRRRSLLLLLAVALAALAVGLGIVRGRIDGWMRSTIEREVGRRTGLQLVIGDLELDLWRLELVFSDLRLDWPDTASGPRRLEIARGRVRIQRRGLPGLATGRVRLGEVVLERPVVRWSAEAATAAAADGVESSVLDLRIRLLRIRDGRLVYADASVPFALDAKDVDARAEWNLATRSLLGELHAKLALERAPLVRPLELSVDGRFRLRRHDLELHRLVVSGEGIHGELEGNLTLAGEPSLVGRGQAFVELESVRALLPPESGSFDGRVAADFTLERGPGPLRLRGELELSRGRLGGLVLDSAVASARYASGRLQLVELQADAFGGEVTGTFDLELPSSRFDTKLLGRGLDAGRLFAQVGLSLPVAGIVDAELVGGGVADRRSTWSGSGTFGVRPEPGDESRVELDGRGTFECRAGVIDADADLTTGATALRAELELDLSRPDSGRLLLAGETSDARDTQLAVERLTDALGVELPELARRAVEGSGELRSALDWGEPVGLELGLDLVGGSFGGRPFDAADLELKLRGDDLDVARVTLTRETERISGWARIRLDPPSVDEMQIEAMSTDPAWLAAVAGYELDVTGELDATLTLSGRETSRRGEGWLRLTHGQAFGEPFDELRADLSVVAGELGSPSWVLEAEGIRAAGSASWAIAEGRWSVAVESSRLDLADLSVLRGPTIPLSGTLGLDGDLRGSADGRLEGLLRVDGREWRYARRSLGDPEGWVTLSETGLAAQLIEPQRSWSLDGRVGTDAGLPFQARVQLDDTLVEIAEGAPDAGWGRVTADARLAGSLADPSELTMRADVEHLLFARGVERVETQAPVAVTFEGGVLRSETIRLAGSGSELEGQVQYDRERDLLEASAGGRLDLGLLVVALPEVRASGSAQLAVEVRGPLAQPSVRGAIRADGGRVRWLGFPQGIDQLDFVISLDGREVQLLSLVGRFGNGEIRASGRAGLEGLRLASFDVGIDAANVRVDYPDGFRGVYEGALTVRGTPRESTIGGELTMLLGQYTEDFELGGQAGRAYAASGETLLPENVYLDLAVAAEGNVWVRNSLADVESSFDVRIGGTLQRPEVTGRLWMFEGGRLDYRDVEYRLVSGSLDFVDRDRLDPYLTLKAETQVKSYTVYLRIEGTLQRIEYELTSDPTLSTQDIIALLTTGNTLEDGPGVGGFSGDVATNYFSGALTAPFAKQLQRLTGLERVRIDSQLAEGESDPTTRITLGEEVAKDVFVVFSTDLERNERQLYEVDWRVTRRFRFTAQRDTQGGIGGDVRFTRRFWWNRPEGIPGPRASRVSRPEALRPTGEALPVAEIRFEGVGREQASELARALPFAPSDPFSRSALFRGVESIKRILVRDGRLEARIDAVGAEGAQGVEVVYRIAPGPRVELVFRGATDREERRLREGLRELWIDSVFPEELYGDAEDWIRQHYQERGFYTVDVGHDEATVDEIRRVSFEIDRGEPVRVERITLHGASSLDEEQIRKQMLTRPSSLFSRREIVPSVLAADVDAIRGLYRNAGFLRVEIADPRVELALSGQTLQIELVIEEGERFTIDSVEFPPGLPFEHDEMARWSGIETGQVFSPTVALLAESRLRNEIDRRGYPDVRVRTDSSIEGTAVTLRLEIDPGARKRVAEVRVEGNARTREKLIRRELTLVPGEVISRERLLDSQRRLYRLGIFRNVRIGYEPMDPGDPAAQRVIVSVEEAAPATTSVSVGYDTEAAGRVSFSIGQQNLRGSDRDLSIQGKLSGLERRLQLVAEDPALIGRRIAGLGSLGWEKSEEEGYTVRRRTAALRLERELNPRWKGFVRYSLQQVDLADVTISPAELQAERLVDGRLGDVGLTLVRDTRDSPFLARKGSYFAWSSRLFAEETGSEFTFVKNNLSAARVWPLGRRRHFVTSIRVGLAFPYGSRGALPISEAFFAGGDSTIRGFPRDGVGPASGGEAQLIFNQEFRHPIWRDLKAVLFYDAGNVWRDTGDLDASDLRHVLGAGLRWETVIGPIRLEYGRKIDREAGESGGELFLAIGGAF